MSTKPGLEREERRISRSEIRASSSDGKLRLSGYASLYNQRSRPLRERSEGFVRTFHEIIKPGAFDGILKTNPDVRLTIAHDPVRTLARTSAGTLNLRSDSKGLKFDAVLPDTSEARDLHENVKAGNLSECSFVFSNPTATWSDCTGDDGQPSTLRTISNFDNGALSDVSVVPTGAYPNTSVNARANRDEADDSDETEEDAAEDEFDLFGPEYDPTQEDERHSDDGQCDSPRCACQNRSCQQRNSLGDVLNERVLCKRVAGRDLPQRCFAYSGNARATQTWAYPVNSREASEKSLQLFASGRKTLGAARDAVGKKIAEACRTFSELLAAGGGARAKKAALAGAAIVKDLTTQSRADAVAARKRLAIQQLAGAL